MSCVLEDKALVAAVLCDLSRQFEAQANNNTNELLAKLLLTMENTVVPRETIPRSVQFLELVEQCNFCEALQHGTIEFNAACRNLNNQFQSVITTDADCCVLYARLSVDWQFSVVVLFIGYHLAVSTCNVRAQTSALVSLLKIVVENAKKYQVGVKMGTLLMKKYNTFLKLSDKYDCCISVAFAAHGLSEEFYPTAVFYYTSAWKIAKLNFPDVGRFAPSKLLCLLARELNDETLDALIEFTEPLLCLTWVESLGQTAEMSDLLYNVALLIFRGKLRETWLTAHTLMHRAAFANNTDAQVWINLVRHIQEKKLYDKETSCAATNQVVHENEMTDSDRQQNEKL